MSKKSKTGDDCADKAKNIDSSKEAVNEADKSLSDTDTPTTPSEKISEFTNLSMGGGAGTPLYPFSST